MSLVHVYTCVHLCTSSEGLSRRPGQLPAAGDSPVSHATAPEGLAACLAVRSFGLWSFRV